MMMRPLINPKEHQPGISPGFTLCFLLNGEDVLMIHRRFPPNQGLWNGVGGHINPGETPREAVIREVLEETGYQINDPQFAGLLTWDGFEIPPGTIAIFTAEAPHRDFVANHEGRLAWQPRDWACSSPEVVDNIHVFLPRILAGEEPRHYHFSYHNQERIREVISGLPDNFDLDRPLFAMDEIVEEQRGEYLLSTDKDRLQIDVIEDFLAKRSYWAAGRARDVIERSIQHSVCFGIYHQGVQVGFARMVTDQATIAWLADVYVDDSHQGQGLGKWLVLAACNYADERHIKRMVLVTSDAQSLYATYGGFERVEKPEDWMTRLKPDTD